MYKVAVLMSTYNGEKYLREQIDSILAQRDVDVTLFIRDDGSADCTIEIIKKYQRGNSSIKLNIGKNVGVGNSFLQLVYDAGDGFDYYAFSDQDDVWMPEKTYKAINKINEKEDPCLYCSNQTLIDQSGSIIAVRRKKPIHQDPLSILCNNEVTGCTMLWNKALYCLLADRKRRPSQELLKIRIHDVWVAMVASVVGEIYYDEKAYINYRQHENNVVGVKKGSLLKEWKKKISNPELRNGRSLLAKEVYDKYNDFITDDAVNSMLVKCRNYKMSLKSKILLFKDIDVQRCSNESKIMYGMKIFLNLF